jgi:hypothetical protein
MISLCTALVTSLPTRYRPWAEALLDAILLSGASFAAVLLATPYELVQADPTRVLFACFTPSLVLFIASLKASFLVREPTTPVKMPSDPPILDQRVG